MVDYDFELNYPSGTIITENNDEISLNTIEIYFKNKNLINKKSEELIDTLDEKQDKNDLRFLVRYLETDEEGRSKLQKIDKTKETFRIEFKNGDYIDSCKMESSSTGYCEISKIVKGD